MQTEMKITNENLGKCSVFDKTLEYQCSITLLGRVVQAKSKLPALFHGSHFMPSVRRYLLLCIFKRNISDFKGFFLILWL